MTTPRLLPPRAVIFDLDDTLLNSYRHPERTWLGIIAEHAEALGEHDTRWVTAEVLARVLEFTDNDEGRKLWRLEGDATRRKVVRSAFHRLNLARPSGSEPLHGVDADRIADRFETYLEANITLKPRAHEMLDTLAARGLRLALLTNGAGWRQRGKLARFDLARHFERIQIEAEEGVGKPDPEAFLRLLRRLDLTPAEAWMVGDDAAFDVEAAAGLGLPAVQFCADATAPSLSAAAHVSDLAELPPLLDRAGPAPPH